MTAQTKRINSKPHIRHRSGCRCCKGTLWVEDIPHPSTRYVTIITEEIKEVAVVTTRYKSHGGWVVRPDSLTPQQSQVYKLIAKYPNKNYNQLWAKSGYRINQDSLKVLLSIMFKAGVLTRSRRNPAHAFAYQINPDPDVKVGLYAPP